WGRVDVFVKIDDPAGRVGRIRLDLELARAYRDQLVHLREELGLGGEPSLDLLVGLRDVFTFEDEELNAEAFLPGLEQILNLALDNLVKMRQTEGGTIALDLTRRLAAMSAWTEELESRQRTVAAGLKDRLEARIKVLTEGLEVDQWRLAQEVAYLAERGDITEEIVRLRSHLEQFRHRLEGSGPAGRRLDFLVQEINREVNTIGSKSQDVDMTNLVVDLKTELEKVREQIQNVE
ncbi:MAG: YicC/YloC family endoribonuclease, partial [Thermodesulfobacteriota bacterium]